MTAGGRRARRTVAVLVVAAACTAALGAPASGSGARRDLFDPTPRARGAVTVVGDSVLLGSTINVPTIVDRLAEQGWGPIRARAVGSATSGAFSVANEYRVSTWIDGWQQAGWDAPVVLVNLGVNDSGFCRADLACARRAITHVLDAIGPGHRVWWPKITKESPSSSSAATWNTALDQIAAERPDVWTWDWPGVFASGGFSSPDDIHLSPDGYRARSRLMAEALTADLDVAMRVDTDPPTLRAAGAPGELLAVEPQRVLDTRGGPTGRLGPGGVIELDLTGRVPTGTTAVGLYVTVVDPGAAGHVSVAPCVEGATYGTTSMLNHPPAATRGASTIVALGAGDTVCLFSHAASDLVVDLQTVVVPDGLRFTPQTPPRRLLDTRATGRADRLEIAIPGSAELAAVNITVTGSHGPGHVTAHACVDDPPLTSVLNHGAGETIASFAFVPVSDAGTICLDPFADTDVVVDLTGTAAADGELRFVPTDPTRTIDTRNGVGGWGFVHGGGQTIDAVVAPADAAAVSGTITLVQPVADSHLRSWGCDGELPLTSAVNAAAWTTYANGATVGVSDGTLCVGAHSTGQTLFDTTGWWIP